MTLLTCPYCGGIPTMTRDRDGEITVGCEHIAIYVGCGSIEDATTIWNDWVRRVNDDR